MHYIEFSYKFFNPFLFHAYKKSRRIKRRDKNI